MRNDIMEAGGAMSRQADSQWVIILWFVPRGKDFTEAQTVYGFFPEDKYDAAREIVFSMEVNKFMSCQILSLGIPEVSAHFTLRPHTCCHCGEIVFNVDGQWNTAPTHGTSQYCWVDPVNGSQLHDVEAEDA